MVVTIPRASRFFDTMPSIQILRREGNERLLKILGEVLDKIVPHPEEEEEIEKTANKLLDLTKKTIEDLGIRAQIELEGSVRKGTWIRNDVDFDIFLLFKHTPNVDYKQYFEEVMLKIGSNLGLQYELRYAEHPYIRVKIDGYEADIVPAFLVQPTKIISAVDRTPHHTRYILSKITPNLANEIRLLKAFFKGINVYGAEIKTGGFSGYACELLIIYYGSFIEVLKTIAERKTFFIDLTGKWTKPKATKKFGHFFILIDPTDPNRNVTSPLQIETFSKAQLYTKLFLKKPLLEYFLEKKTTASTEDLSTKIEKRNITLVKLEKNTGLPPDVYWGQAIRIKNALKRLLLRNNDFQLILIDTIESKNSIIVLIETRLSLAPKIKRVRGPPTYAPLENILAFTRKHRKKIIAGPWIENDRIYISVEETSNLKQFLEEHLKKIKIDPSFKNFCVINNKKEIKNLIEKENIEKEFNRKITKKEILKFIELTNQNQH